jgi:hypothetical protein
VEPQGREYVTPEIEKRQHRRAELVTQVRCDALGREDLMLTRDVSVGGMFVTAKDPFPSDSDVALSFRLRAGDPPIASRGKVVYSLPGMGMGITFVDLSEEARQTLQKFVDEAA